MLFSRRDIIKIALPMIIQQVLAVTIGMVDTMMVSKAGEAAVSGVSLVNTLDTMLVVAFISLVTGGSVVVAQFLGEKRTDSARLAAKQLLYASATVAIVISAVVISFRFPLLDLLFGDVEADVMKNAHSYFLYVALSFSLLAIYSSCTAVFNVLGKTFVTLIVSLFMNLTNVVGNAILIYGYGMGAAGAAIATLVSRLLGAAVMLVLIHNRNNTVYIDNVLKYRPDFTIIRAILRIGIPNGVENCMFHFGKLLTQSLISSMGTASIAANAVANTLASFQYMPGTAFSNTMVTVVGRCIGAREKEQAKKYSKILVGVTYLCLWIIVLLTFIFSKQIIGFYDLSENGTRIAYELIIYHAVCAALIWPIGFTLPSAFRAASDVKFTLVVSMFSMWVFRVALSYVFALENIQIFDMTFRGLGMGVIGVWVAMTVDWVFRTGLFLWRYLSGKWLNVYRSIYGE
ncbi:MAG: MATE family efflux transporter [Ruminococcaceae bacterium]|nr:MATE family efflux transporter [Oscillospiraceae bacterium]